MNKTIKKYNWFWVLMVISACSVNNLSSNQNTLYQSLGGEQGIKDIVDSLVIKISKDKQIFPYFAKASVSHFKQGLEMHFCAISNGPCEYTGDSMVDIHTGMNINEADFNRLVELLVEVMEESGVKYTTQNKLLAELAPMRAEIIKI